MAQVEAVGLCFSDLKLLRQFTSYARKSEIVSGIDKSILKEISSYVPGDLLAMSGHEAVVRVCSIEEKVQDIRVKSKKPVQGKVT